MSICARAVDGETGNENQSGFRVQLPDIPDRVVDIRDYGAVSGGVAMNTQAFEAAIRDCAGKGGGRVVVPEGVWLTGPINLKSNIDLHLDKGALVVFSPRFEDYPLIETSFEGEASVRCSSPLNGRNIENIAISGEGIFDGTGHAWRPVKRYKMTNMRWKRLVESGGALDASGSIWWPSANAVNGAALVESLRRSGRTVAIEEYAEAREYLRPALLSLTECRRVLLDGPTFQNSPCWCLHLLLSEEITIRGINVRNPWYAANGDGLDLESCRNVIVQDSCFDAGDDAICLKSGRDESGRRRGRPTERVVVTNCTVYHGHGGFVVGSEMSGGVRDINVSHCTFMGTDVGLRFKSTRGRGGIVEKIYISDINMISIENEAILFDMHYGKRREQVDLEPIPVTEETPIFRDIYMERIVCRGARRAGLLQGLPEMPLSNVHLVSASIIAETGLSCAFAENVTIRNAYIESDKGAVVRIDNSRSITVEGLKCPEDAGTSVRIEGDRTKCIRLVGSGSAMARDRVELAADVPEEQVIREGEL